MEIIIYNIIYICPFYFYNYNSVVCLDIGTEYVLFLCSISSTQKIYNFFGMWCPLKL